jgi:serine phosphatase RsbU (regulator of sigma subunit)
MNDSSAAESTTAFLQQVSLFRTLSREEVLRIATDLQYRRIPDGTLISNEGEACNHFSILLRGEIQVYKSMGTEEERMLASMHSGDFFGEMSIFYSNRRRSASMVAHGEVELLEMEAEPFIDLLNNQPTIAYQVIKVMAARIRNIEDGTINHLREKNQRLSEALHHLKLAQEQLIEKEKIEHELRMARQIQQGILPTEVPAPNGWEISARWEPARSVSGDFYDFLTLSDRLLVIVIGDVTGKGIPASLVMATTCSVLRATILSNPTPGALSPDTVLAQMNGVLCRDMPPGMFATCLLVFLDLVSGEFRYANAGHSLPVMISKAGNKPVIKELWASGMPLGLLPESRYEVQNAALDPGDCLLLLTDGLVEARNPLMDMFGSDRLHAALSRLAEKRSPANAWASEDLIPELLQQLVEFTGPDLEQEDDVTLVSIERK